MLGLTELSADELHRMEELKHELLGLRDRAVLRDEAPAPDQPETMFHFPDGARITLARTRLAPDRQPPSTDTDPANLNYVRWAELADLDTLIDVYGAVRAYNPTSRVVIMAAQDLTQRDVASHLVLIGGLAWVSSPPPGFPVFSRYRLEPGDPGERGAIAVRNSDGTKEG